MPSDAKSDTPAVLPLWLIGFSLLAIAICLVLLVLQFRLRNEAETSGSPTMPWKQRTVRYDHPSPAPRPTYSATSAISRPRVAEPPSVAATNADEPEIPAPDTRVASMAGARVANGGGFAPLSFSGATNRGAIIGRVTLKGKPPPETPIDFGGNDYCAGFRTQPLTTHFFTVDDDGGFADVVVFIREGVNSFQRERKQVELRFGECQIEPYVSAVMRSDLLFIRNTDSIAHNLRVAFSPNSPFKHTLGHGASLSVRFPEAQLFVPVSCDIHPWETAYVSVFDHPFFAVTDKQGNFAITNVPGGRYVLEAFHQKARGTNAITQRTTIERGQTTVVNFVIDAPEQQTEASAN